MKVCFDEIGAKSVTFQCGEDVACGNAVKVISYGEVSSCNAGDAFCGVAEVPFAGCVGVQVGGFVKCGYTGTKPDAGYTALAADSNGGVCVTEGAKEYLVVDADDETVTFMM